MSRYDRAISARVCGSAQACRRVKRRESGKGRGKQALKINKNIAKLPKDYLFTEVAARVAECERATGQKLLKLSIGDVTLPLVPAVAESMKRAAEEMGNAATFRGYGEERGYVFLREAIARQYFRLGAIVDADDIFISDGAKSDCGNLTELFAKKNVVLLPDPVYPVYADANRMAGRKLRFVRACKANEYLPVPPKNVRADVIYLCSPNNPTGAAYTREQLRRWVEYAEGNGAVILYDAAYAAFIGDEAARGGVARSIYEVHGAEFCAIEISSFSKSAGFTGVRCGYTVVPKRLKGGVLKAMWTRRQATKFNGAGYVVQRAAEAALTAEGLEQNAKNIAAYMRNARLLKEVFLRSGCECEGGEFAPYLWLKRPFGATDDEFFERLMYEAGVAVTPGAGFGKGGEGYFRFSAFCSEKTASEAAERLKIFLKNGG